jgi:hypothetical protein
MFIKNNEKISRDTYFFSSLLNIPAKNVVTMTAMIVTLFKKGQSCFVFSLGVM